MIPTTTIPVHPPLQSETVLTILDKILARIDALIERAKVQSNAHLQA